MNDLPRRRALINGLYIEFQSRNTSIATVRWHSRFKMRYRTKADAIEAKAVWEERGRILWPGDFAKPKPLPNPTHTATRSTITNHQQEFRI